MNRTYQNPANSTPPRLDQHSDPLVQWWQETIADSRRGKLPFPPQGEWSLREYARVVGERRGFLPDALLKRYLIAGLNEPPPLAEREKLVRHPFQEMITCLAQKESRTSIRPSSPGMLAVIPEGRVLTVATLVSQICPSATSEASSTATSLRGKRERRLSWESASGSSSTETTVPAVVPSESFQPVSSPVLASAPRPRRKRRKRGTFCSPSLSSPESTRTFEPAAESAGPQSALVRVVPEAAAERIIPDPAAVKMVFESVATNDISESVSERAAADTAAEALLRAVSAPQDMPIAVTAKTLSNYLSSLVKILEVPVRPVLPSSPASTAEESAGFKSDAERAVSMVTTEKSVSEPMMECVDSESVSEDFESVDETVGPVPASPSATAPLVPDYLPPATPLVSVPLPVAAVPTVTQPLYGSPVFPVKAQPRTVSTISPPKPARVPRQRSTSRRPKTTVPLTHPGQSPNPSGSVMYELQLSYGLFGKASEESITIIHPAGDERMHKFL
ncbi:hypothetical protein PO909_005885 [Leuciscus waleckii]